ncbi:MAG TPA: hypothetical protein VF193_14610 [Steroidobacter sp.]
MSRSERRNPFIAGAPVLGPVLLARVQELNLDYLELLAAEHRAGGSHQLEHVPERLRAAFAGLSSSARSLLAAVPYTLYSLGFEDETFWLSLADMQGLRGARIEERYGVPEGGRLDTQFATLALLHAWHVTSTSRMAARVVYAMPDSIAARFVAMPLSRIYRMAFEHPDLLMPRWPTNPGFWPDLLRFAQGHDRERLATAKLLGNQLIAAELEVAAARHRRKNIGIRFDSPRLRARRRQLELRRGGKK